MDRVEPFEIGTEEVDALQVGTQVLLGLGTNLGDRRGQLQKAVRGLEMQMTVTAVSPLYQTPPFGPIPQPDFLNICVAAATTQSPQELFQFIKALETELGRRPAVRWGPRLIDIDILFYGTEIIDQPALQIPHIGIPERAFVLTPLADITPDFIHPTLEKTVAELLTAVDPTNVQRLPEPLFQD